MEQEPMMQPEGPVVRLVVALCLLLGVLALGSTGAAAEVEEPPPPPPPADDGCPSCDGHADVDPNGKTISASAEYPWMDESGGGVPVPTGSSYLDGCHWSQVRAGETRDLHPVAGAWTVTFDAPNWLVWCPPQLTVYTYFPVGDPPPPTVVADMIADAYDRTPVEFFNPYSSPAGDDDIPFITQMPTYVWLDQGVWNQPVSAEASIPGVFSVTTTARAADATWTGADEPVSPGCIPPGSPYRFGVGGDRGQDPAACSLVYTHSSATGDRELHVAVEWEVSYTCSIPVACGGGGPLPPITTESTRAVIVGEIQAIEQ